MNMAPVEIDFETLRMTLSWFKAEKCKKGWLKDYIKLFGIENIEHLKPLRAMMENFLIGGDNAEYYLQTWIVNKVK